MERASLVYPQMPDYFLKYTSVCSGDIASQSPSPPPADFSKVVVDFAYKDKICAAFNIHLKHYFVLAVELSHTNLPHGHNLSRRD